MSVMNKSTSQYQQKKIPVQDKNQLNGDIAKKAPITSNTPVSLWSNFWYGLGMLAIIVVPPLIPGTTIRSLIMGYMFMIVSIYTIAAISTAIKTLNPTKTPKRGNYKMSNR